MITMMDFQTRTKETSDYDKAPGVRGHAVLSLGLVTEMGVLAVITKELVDRKEGVDENEQLGRLADCFGNSLWYLSELCNHWELNLEDVARRALERRKEMKAEKLIGKSKEEM